MYDDHDYKSQHSFLIARKLIDNNARNNNKKWFTEFPLSCVARNAKHFDALNSYTKFRLKMLEHSLKIGNKSMDIGQQHA